MGKQLSKILKKVHNTRIVEVRKMITPKELAEQLPLEEKQASVVEKSRKAIEDILAGRDGRVVAIVGPCSIHNVEEALEYATMLADIAEKVKDRILVVMRTYFEKPRTVSGWKGLIKDPDLDGSYKIDKGLYLARKLLLKVNELGLPCATEALEVFTPQYLMDLVSWAAIGARTSESQLHRELASGLSMPVGFKNSTSGDIGVAINAIRAASKESQFIGINRDGMVELFHTEGNPYGHLILRGGSDGPNYDAETVKRASSKLSSFNLIDKVIVDCSHGNSNKDYERQGDVLRAVVDHIKGKLPIAGVMLESNINPGRQDIGQAPLLKGVSITDSCIGIEKTKELLYEAYEELAKE
ncbi:MAG: 3-deoxy-7-phosphoheptulonate synthase [Methanobacteriota archaeon]|nr:MAG: 3-deoxy-7-phosphoheptulonate synthase [Euryarchaeota archaeon]